MDAQAEVYESWRRDPEGFWMARAAAVEWERPPTRALDDSAAPLYRWFPDGRLNTCHNALDRHVAAGHGDRLALIHDSPVTGVERAFTFGELRDEVARVAGAFARLGVGRGDRVVIYMPMVPEAVMAMLACARLGAVHSVVFGGFAARELAARIDDCRPRLVVTASCGIEPRRVVEYVPLVDRALQSSGHRPDACIVLQRPEHPAELTPGRDVEWHEALAGAEPAGCVPVEATDPLYVLYTSGTTGRPKGVVRDNGGHAVALDWSMHAVYGVAPGEVYWAASDIGWVVGHSYCVYGPLLHGCTTVIYEGKPVGTPDASTFWRVCAQHRVAAMFTAPTAIRGIKREDPGAEGVGGHDLSALRTLFLAGERCDPDTLEWARRAIDRPVIDHWWQTETGWSIAANCVGLGALPVKPGSPTRAVAGYDLRVLDEEGRDLPAGEIGALCVRLPLPPGCAPTLWGDDARWVETYLTEHPGYYASGDAGFVDEDGYVYVMSRLDDVINVAGHRLSTGQMEEVVAEHPVVAECAVVGVADALKGQLPVAFVVLSAGADADEATVGDEVVERVRDRIGPVAALREVHVVRALPKTRSGKVLRGTVRRMANGEPWTVPATVEDAGVLDEFRELLAGTGRSVLSAT